MSIENKSKTPKWRVGLSILSFTASTAVLLGVVTNTISLTDETLRQGRKQGREDFKIELKENSQEIITPFDYTINAAGDTIVTSYDTVYKVKSFSLQPQ